MRSSRQHVGRETGTRLGSVGPGQLIATAADSAPAVFAAGLDGDGDLDVLPASSSRHIAWYENMNGLGSFGPEQVITTNADSAQSVFAADLDGDGDLDVLSASSYDDKIAWYENRHDERSAGAGPLQTTTATAESAGSG